jgi:hypothetical protein
MRIFLNLLCLCLLSLPLSARCEEEINMGPSVGGGDGSMVEAGRVPEAACEATGGEMKINLSETQPQGGDASLDLTGSVSSFDSFKACSGNQGTL